MRFWKERKQCSGKRVAVLCCNAKAQRDKAAKKSRPAPTRKSGITPADKHYIKLWHSFEAYIIWRRSDSPSRWIAAFTAHNSSIFWHKGYLQTPWSHRKWGGHFYGTYTHNFYSTSFRKYAVILGRDQDTCNSPGITVLITGSLLLVLAEKPAAHTEREWCRDWDLCYADAGYQI